MANQIHHQPAFGIWWSPRFSVYGQIGSLARGVTSAVRGCTLRKINRVRTQRALRNTVNRRSALELRVGGYWDVEIAFQIAKKAAASPIKSGVMSGAFGSSGINLPLDMSSTATVTGGPLVGSSACFII